MARYIDAEKLSANLLKQWKTADKEKAENISNIISSVVVPIVVDTPTEDVAPIVHAHWIYSGDEEDCDSYYRNCSACGNQDYVYAKDNSRNDGDYCHCCGAIMDEEIRDCRYCNYAQCSSHKDETVYCWLDVGEYIEKPDAEAKDCPFFRFCDIFPKT